MIEDGITDVGQSVFICYKNITSVTIAGSVKDFAPNAFKSCKNISVVEVKGATAETLAEPCIIHLYRSANFVGGAINIKIGVLIPGIIPVM